MDSGQLGGDQVPGGGRGFWLQLCLPPPEGLGGRLFGNSRGPARSSLIRRL